MKLRKIIIHNFRSFIDESIDIHDFSLLVGKNNIGKTNLLTAMRLFYEDGIKFSKVIDFPKLKNIDNESWVELWFKTTENEQLTLSDLYKSDDRILRVRKYFLSSDKSLVKSGQSNIYGYEQGNLSKNLFYGAKNVSQAKIGKIIYIPEICNANDNLKLSGPSTLRAIVEFLMEKVIEDSPSFQDLQRAFSIFDKNMKKESSEDGFSLKNLENEINSKLDNWDIKFGIQLNTISTNQITKNLISHYIEDNQLDSQRVSINCIGQGLQRHIIYTLIQTSTKYNKKINNSTKKDFSPNLSLILFEEPEAFLHPAQQENLNSDLHKISRDENQQVICTSHSEIFVNKNIEFLQSIIRLEKNEGKTIVFQINKDEIKELFDENNSLYRYLSNLLSDTNVEQSVKDYINNNIVSPENIPQRLLEEEALRFFLWLDKERSCSFFADHVIICEGASEKCFIDYLIKSEWSDQKIDNIYILDSMGKYNIHRFMNLFSHLGITHSVLYDSDGDRGVQKYINDFVNSKRNHFTKEIHSFDDRFEVFLGIQETCNKDYKKPLNILWNYHKEKISQEKIDEMKGIFISLL